MYRRFVKHNYVLSIIHCYGISVYIAFFTVNSSVYSAARSFCWQKFHGKGIKLKTFPQGNVISLCSVVVRCSRVGPKVPGSRPTQLFFFFLLSSFCVVVFYKDVRK